MSSRNGDSGAVVVQRENGETQVQQIKDVPLFDVSTAKFPAWEQNYIYLAKLYGLFEISPRESVPQLLTKMSIAALQEAFPCENVKKTFHCLEHSHTCYRG